ncbi:MAG: response regulator [Hahellaceae bacterium]|jgi:two-component system response regulator|nr:response regulator [Hahellaceae bacterium]MCP5211569.1 response regulator [Hahellaceae bacterium]
MTAETILLVEDNEDDELLAIRALKKAATPSKVVVARDGEEALDYVYAQGKFAERNKLELPRVILLDINLPKLSGLQVLESIRSHATTRLIPIVLLTSSDEEQDMLAGYSLGANSYIRKPVDFDEFIEEIGLLGRYWLGMNRTPNER